MMSSSPDALARARALARSGQLSQAEAALRRLLARDAGDAGVLAELAQVLAQRGQREPAAHFARAVVALKAPSGDALFAAGTTLDALGMFAAAHGAFERAATIAPGSGGAHNGVGLMLMRERRAGEAVAHFERARALMPESAPILANLAWAFSESWRVAEAIGLLRESIARFPTSHDLLQQLPYLLNYESDDSRELLEAHRQLARAIEGDATAHAPAAALPALALPGAGTCPRRVGLLSGDFREHSVARFIEPLLREHDRSAIEFHCIATSAAADDTTARLRTLAAGWHDVSRLDDAGATALIRRERLDALVDLAVYTRGNRAGVLARRAAGVQINYLGYPNTSALASMDVRLIDSTTDPAGSDGVSSERLVRLDPCFLCFQPALAARDLPARGPARDGPVTFGSFNHLMKLSARTLDVWSEILRQTPGSTLLLKASALAEADVASRVRAAFASRGVDPSRLEIVPFLASFAEHYRLYERVDIALDPMPYNGTTTTCEALWMGVPVVTLAGRVHASRVGASILRTIGRAELVSNDVATYVATARALASDSARRSELHASLRDSMRASPLCDAKGFASRFARAIDEACERTGSARRA